MSTTILERQVMSDIENLILRPRFSDLPVVTNPFSKTDKSFDAWYNTLKSLKPSDIMSLIEPALIRNRKDEKFILDMSTYGMRHEPYTLYTGCIATCVVAETLDIPVSELLSNNSYAKFRHIYTSSHYNQEIGAVTRFYNALNFLRQGYVTSFVGYMAGINPGLNALLRRNRGYILGDGLFMFSNSREEHITCQLKGVQQVICKLQEINL